MVDERFKNKIQEEFAPEQSEEWFSKSSKKFLHNIDTFYYSVKLLDDFTQNGHSKNVVRFRNYLKLFSKLEFGNCKALNIPGCEELVAYNFGYSKYYKVQLSYPDMFDIFIAPVVPPGADGTDSVTSEIIVQLRSYMLWLMGPQEAFHTSFIFVKMLCDYFKLGIGEVKENRIDYAWHSNYLSAPEKFFQIDHFHEMQVSSFRGVSYHYSFKSGGEYENDYVALGKRSDKVFVRIYLKSKEVVEMGYKPWFLKLWYDNKLISKYDFYCFEYAYVEHSWKKLDLARLKFYSEYGSDDYFIRMCNKYLNNDVSYNYDEIAMLANKLTPRVTSIMNVEFQTMRRGTKSYVLHDFRKVYPDPLTERVDMYFDNWEPIIEYLTFSTLRLTIPENDDKGKPLPKSKRRNAPFWERLRSTSCEYIPYSADGQKLVREYSRKLNADLVKRKLLNNVVSFGFYKKGVNEDTVEKDCMDALLRLNDNDIKNMTSYKNKQRMVKNRIDYSECFDDENYESAFDLVNRETGEVVS